MSHDALGYRCFCKLVTVWPQKVNGRRIISWKTTLKKYVSQNFKRSEILDFVQRDFPEYTWSTAILDRRLRHFGIYYINYDTPVTAVSDAVQKEFEGPGKLLGYRAMNQKLRTEHNVQVPRHLVYNVMAELDPEGARSQKPSKKKEKSKGSLHIRRTVMDSFFRWSRQTMWLSKFHISTGCIRRYWHVFTQNPLFLCMLLKFEPFSYSQDVPSISVRFTDAAKKSAS